MLDNSYSNWEKKMKRIASLILATTLFTSPALAESPISIQVGYSPGGSYDVVARTVAEHLGKHLPGNPGIFVENVTGAGSLKLAKITMANGVSSDVKIASISSALALRPIFKPESSDFDPQAVHYVMAMTNAASYCIAHKQSGITSLQQFLDDPDAKAGSTGKGSSTYTYPAAIRSAMGGQFQIVTGFKGASEINLAMERGDVDVRCGIGSSAINSGGLLDRVNIIAELATSPHGEFENIEFALDFAPSENKEALSLVFSSGTIHHPFIVSPKTDPNMVEMLRTAFDALATDEDFLKAAQERNLTPAFTSGAKVAEIIDALIATPEGIKEQARQFVK